MQFTSKLSPGRALRGLSRRLRSATGRIRRDEDGAIALMVAGSVMSIILVIGGSVDVYRYEMLRKRAQNTLDRAVLAAAALDQKVTDGEAVVRSYMKSAGLELPPGTTFVDCPKAGPAVCCPLEAAASQLRCLTTWSTYKRSFRSMKVTANYEMEMAFLWLAGQEQWDVPVQASALERERKVEISLMLDLSSSMGKRTSDGAYRINALKDAARTFTSIMLDTDVKRKHTSISLVPYTQHVNVGREMFNHLVGGEANRWHDYSSCFHLDSDDYEGDGMPDFQNLDQIAFYTRHSHQGLYKWKNGPKRWDLDKSNRDNRANKDYYGKWVVNSSMMRCAPDAHAYSTRDPENLVLVDADGNPLGDDPVVTLTDPNVPSLANGRKLKLWTSRVFYHVGECAKTEEKSDLSCHESGNNKVYKTVQEAYGDGDLIYVDDPHAITYLSNDPDELGRRIRDMPLLSGTGTDMALKYSYLTLDPAFRSTWKSALDNDVVAQGTRPDDFDKRPRDFGETGAFKYMIVMTDGRIDGQQEKVQGDGSGASPILYNADGNYTEGTDWRDVPGHDDDDARGHFDALCADARDNEIVIFTIGFDLKGTDDATKKTRKSLENCASTSSHYFDVEGDGLNDAFNAIAATIQKVRLTS